jgi:hypothetical protein
VEAKEVLSSSKWVQAMIITDWLINFISEAESIHPMSSQVMHCMWGWVMYRNTHKRWDRWNTVKSKEHAKMDQNFR